jgi:hypothetical protein
MSTLPGASANRTFDVSTTQMVVAIRLRLKPSVWTATAPRPRVNAVRYECRLPRSPPYSP